MKRLLTLLFALMLLLCACGAAGSAETEGTLDLDAVDDALDLLEILKPEGWDENSYGMYIYDVWDADFLPELFPGQVEGTKVSQTDFKDYHHDVLSSNYSVGPVWFDNAEDYREFSVSFYATAEQLEQYIAGAKAMGYTGGETTASDDVWREFSFWHPEGWLLYIFFNTNDDDGGSFDGCASVSLTDSLFDRPASIAGVKLPTVGAPAYDYLAGSCYEVYSYAADSMDVLNVDWNGAFPNNEEYSWYIYFTYYGADVAAAAAYKETLAADGWEVVRDYSGEAGELRCTLRKGEVYMVVNCYNDTLLEIGFADMEENLSY